MPGDARASVKPTCGTSAKVVDLYISYMCGFLFLFFFGIYLFLFFPSIYDRCMYVCMVITYSRVWINQVRLPILLVVS